MSTFNPHRFVQPDTLKAISPSRLLNFLQPFHEYLEKRGMIFPEKTSKQIDIQRLAAILVNPDDRVPEEMVDALYFVHEMATPDCMNRLLNAAKEKGFKLEHDPESSPADVAVQLWLVDRDLLENQHALGMITKPRSFMYYCGSYGEEGKFSTPSHETILALESGMDDWFNEHRRGRGSKVFHFDLGKKINFLVCHGMPFKREGSLKDGQSTSVYFRPEKHDVLVYDRELDELCINAGTKGEREMYLEQFGLHLFGDAGYFPGEEKYTLAPLKRDGSATIVCSDVRGLDWIRLKEISIYWGGEYKEIEIRKATDLFSALEARKTVLNSNARLINAAFEVKFSNSKRPRSVIIRPSNRAQFMRDDDSGIIEEWLTKRGFILHTVVENEDTESVMVDTGDFAGPFRHNEGMAATTGI